MAPPFVGGRLNLETIRIRLTTSQGGFVPLLVHKRAELEPKLSDMHAKTLRGPYGTKTQRAARESKHIKGYDEQQARCSHCDFPSLNDGGMRRNLWRVKIRAQSRSTYFGGPRVSLRPTQSTDAGAEPLPPC